MKSEITAEQFLEVLRVNMPDTRELDLRISKLERGAATIELTHDDRRLRPGGTISGPTLFTLADLGMYLVTMSIVGLEPLAVTTDLTIHFLRKPAPATLICDCRALKAGKRLVIVDATIRSEGADDAVAHVVGTYSVPPK